MGQTNQRIKLTTLLLFCCIVAQAQYNIGFEHSTSIIFSDQGSLRLATTGGFSNPQFSEIHLNTDGAMDLFVFDRGNDTWRTFLYNSATSQYDYHPGFEAIFPSGLNELVLLRDYDCDDDNDLFTYNNGKFQVYKNDGEFPPGFKLETDAIQSDYGSLVTSAFILPGDVPAILDVDDDGDIDILTFGNGDSENTLVWHQNLSMDVYGTCDSLEFQVNTECWGGFQEPPNASILEAIACRPEILPPIPYNYAARFHPGSAVLLTDTDGDGDMDIALGDIQTKTFVFAPNVGDATSPDLDVLQQTTNFPNSTDPVKMQYMIAGYEIDANHDGKMDLIATTNNNIDSSCNSGHTWLYNNSSSSGSDYRLETKQFLLEDMVDLGTGTVPLTIDVNGDGLLDLLIASDFTRTPTLTKRSRLYYFDNTGSATNPVFSLEDSDFASLSTFGFNGASPALGDLDNDGDLDMLIGDADGFLHYFRNDPSGGEASFTLINPNYMGINTLGQNAAPEIADINGDGLLDLLVGERVGTIAYFENTGSTNAPQFSQAATNAKFGKVDVSFFCCNGYAAPRFIDNPAFGDKPYLFVGTSEKRINVYEISTNLSDSFQFVDSILLLADRITPAIADYDNDEIYDLLVGTGEGGLKYMQRGGNYSVGLPSISTLDMSTALKVYPNPAADDVHFELSNHMSGNLFIYNSSGQLMRIFKISESSRNTISTAGLPNGIYIAKWSDDQHYLTSKFIVNK